MFNDSNGVAFSVALQPHGDGMAVFITHPAFNGGVSFPVTGCLPVPGAFASAQAWAEQFVRETPESLTDLAGVRHDRAL